MYASLGRLTHEYQNKSILRLQPTCYSVRPLWINNSVFLFFLISKNVNKNKPDRTDFNYLSCGHGSWHLSPINPAPQLQMPVTWSQLTSPLQSHVDIHALPQLPAGHGWNNKTGACVSLIMTTTSITCRQLGNYTFIGTVGWHNDVGYSLGLKSSCLCLYHLWSKSLIQQQAENRTEVDVFKCNQKRI